MFAYVRSTNKYRNFGGIFDLSRMTAQLEELEAKMGQADFWNDARAAGGVSRQRGPVSHQQCGPHTARAQQ